MLWIDTFLSPASFSSQSLYPPTHSITLLVRFVTPRSRNMSVESQTCFTPNLAQSPLPFEASEATATTAPQFIIAEVAMLSSPVDGLRGAEANALSPPLSNLRLTAPAPPNALHGTLTDYASGAGGAAPMYFQQPMPSSQMPAVCTSYTGGMPAVRLSAANMYEYNGAPQVFGPPSDRTSYPVQMQENFDSLLAAQSGAAEGFNNLNSGVNFVQLPASDPAAVAPAAAPAAAPPDIGVTGLNDDDINEIFRGFYPNEAALPPLQPGTNGASLSNQMFVSPHYAPQPSANAFPPTSTSSQYTHN